MFTPTIHFRTASRLALALLATLLLAALPFPHAAQKADPPGQQPQPSQTPPSQPMGGVSTGTALVSATRRTVGVVDPKAPKVFEDVTAQTGLAAFRHR
ncbi:MAG TPA: hypothetical protein VF240_13815, partial [Pyrinomonadaceae bacterium]